jgi:hypothetical protein
MTLLTAKRTAAYIKKMSCLRIKQKDFKAISL